MSLKSDIVGFHQSIDRALHRVSKLSAARERRALAGRVSVSYTRKNHSNREIHQLLLQILRAAGKPSSRSKLSTLATKLRRCDCHGRGAHYLHAVADLAEASAKLSRKTHKYSPDQPRDPETGQWVDAWGSASEALSSMSRETASGIKDAVSGALSGASEKLASGARVVRESVGEALSHPSAPVMIAETLILAAAAAFFFYFHRSATAMQMGLAAIDFGLKGLRFLRRIP